MILRHVIIFENRQLGLKTNGCFKDVF